MSFVTYPSPTLAKLRSREQEVVDQQCPIADNVGNSVDVQFVVEVFGSLPTSSFGRFAYIYENQCMLRCGVQKIIDHLVLPHRFRLASNGD